MSNNNITQPPSDLVKISIVPSDDMSSCFRMPYKLAAGGKDHSITTSVINSLLNDSVLKGGSDLSTLGSLGDEIDNLNEKYSIS